MIRDCELQENTYRLVKGNDVVAIGEERTEAEPPTVSIYRNDSGELYPDDFYQHMAILPRVVTPVAKIFLEDIQVGDPGELLSRDQEKLRQLIWANRYLLISKGNALPPAARGAICNIDVGDATRSHKGYVRSHPSFAKSWLI